MPLSQRNLVKHLQTSSPFEPMITQTKDKLLNKYRKRIREGAISNAKKQLALRGITAAELDPDELEILVHDEEVKLRGRLKNYSLAALIAALTLGHF